MANYTSLSEKLDPEEVHQIMDGCFQILMDEIHRYEGTINQFTGDGVMALFGAPLAHEDHAQRACHAALAIQKAMADYGEKVQKEYGVAFQLRIGLNSGPVVVGKIGDDLRMDYTAVGDTTNLASRMQSLASARHHPGLLAHPPAGPGLLRVPASGQARGQGQGGAPGGLSAPRGQPRWRPGSRPPLPEASPGSWAGRRRCQTLLEAFEKVQSGSGQVVGIVGEAGVGKSRLLLEFSQPLPRRASLPGRPLPPLRGLHALSAHPGHPEILLRHQGGGPGGPHQEEAGGEDALPRSQPSRASCRPSRSSSP